MQRFVYGHCTMITSDPYLAKSPLNSIARICEGSALCNYTRGLCSHNLMLLTDISVLQFYTKAHEIFEKNTSTQAQSRLALWIAYRITETYYDSSKSAMAVRCVYLRGHVNIPMFISCSEYSPNASRGPIVEKNGMITAASLGNMVCVCSTLVAR